MGAVDCLDVYVRVYILITVSTTNQATAEEMTMEMTITINLTEDGMGPGSIRADAESYRDFVERRLADIYPAADITVTLLRTGEVTSRTVAVDETEHHDVDDVMQRLWGEFCADTTLWPSTR